MHSHDRTLLAKLGFNDADRKAPEHDLACRYLAYEVPQKIWRWVFPGDYSSIEQPESKISSRINGSTEVHLTKGEGQYATTIGFIDVMLTGYMATRDNRDGKTWFESGKLLIEVKVDPNPVSDAIRQIKTYMAWANCDKAVLASIGSVGTGELLQLSEENIAHVRLNEAFFEWCKIPPSSQHPIPRSLVF